jgi:hypothetical protein
MPDSKMKNRPAGVGFADRLEGIERFGNPIDAQTNNHFKRLSPPVRHLVINYGLSASVARVVCDLSGFGGGRCK